MLYGYARVSSKDQNIDRQVIALQEAGVELENIFSDKLSGATFNRPAYKKLLQAVKKEIVLL